MNKAWDSFSSSHRYFPEVGMSIDTSRMGLGKDSFHKSPYLDKALEEMQALEAGSIANPDENRQVGHYWLRTPEIAPGNIGEEVKQSIAAIKDFVTKLKSGSVLSTNGKKFRRALLIGIGGSALGPQFISEALARVDRDITLHFSDNTDPDGMRKTLLELDSELDATLFIVVSKSGGTVETRNGMLEAKNFCSIRDVPFARHAVAITCAGSKLDQQAESEGWLTRLHMWDWVGGRTSLFSAVGLLPALLEGIDIDAMLHGARTMDELTRIDEAAANPALLLALSWLRATEGIAKRDMVVLPYKDRLGLFAKYLQQLVMESLGKEFDLLGRTVNQGLVVYGNKGSTDQHAYIQQLREGPDNFFALFIEVLSDYAIENAPQKELEVEPGITSADYLSGFLHGTKLALAEKSKLSLTITIDELSPFTVGALVALFERAVGFYASFVDINAYHQPGVEAGKKAAGNIINLQRQVSEWTGKNKGKNKFSAESVAVELGEPEVAELVFNILLRFAVNERFGVKIVRGKTAGETFFAVG